jgi:hypothetical protein
MLLLAAMITMIVIAFSLLYTTCTYPGASLICENYGAVVNVKQHFETFQVKPLKAEAALYTLLSASDGEINASTCIKFIDCVESCDKEYKCPPGYELCKDKCRRYYLMEKGVCSIPENPCEEGEEVYMVRKICKPPCHECEDNTNIKCRGVSSDVSDDLYPCGGCRFTIASIRYNYIAVWCQRDAELVPKPEQVEVCRKAYGEAYSVEKCEEFLRNTLEKVWKNKARLSFGNFEIIVHPEKWENVHPTKITQYLFIPFPKKLIYVTLEVW